MIYLLQQFGLAFFATFGFAIIFRVPLRHIPACIITGGLGWITYEVTMVYLQSPAFGCFTGACVVGLMSTICSKVCKDASTIFIIPGILCLVPGSHIYRTMEALIAHRLEDFADVGLQTLFMAGAIALGLLVIGAVMNVIRSIIKRTISLKELLERR